jgi:hypothetical protein
MFKEHTSPVDFAAQWMASGFPAVSHDPQGRTIRVTFTDRADSVLHAIVTPNYAA